MVGGRTAAVLWGVASRTISIEVEAFLCNCRHESEAIDKIVVSRKPNNPGWEYTNCISIEGKDSHQRMFWIWH